MRHAVKRIVRQSIRRFGWDLRRIEHFGEPTLADFLRLQAIDLVLDVGANEGQFAIELREAGYSGDIMSFEPIASAYEKLAANAARDPKWQACKVALGDRRSIAKIEITALSVFSSMQPQAERLRDWHPGTKIVGSERVEIVPLDSIVHPVPDRRIFLKVDTQGSEERILAGAQNVLSQACGVQLELPVVHFYENVWSLTDAIAFMERAGFVIAQLRPVVYLPGTGSLGEIDCVFRRDHQKNPRHE
jgi:FkbM family methyltransferase